jgi:hypothetical protein
LKLLTVLVLVGLLSGCETVAVEAMGEFARTLLTDSAPPEPAYRRSGTNYLEPKVLASSTEMIRVKYLSVSARAEHQQALQLIIDHCGASYIETSRVELYGWTTVEADCTHDSD